MAHRKFICFCHAKNGRAGCYNSFPSLTIWGSPCQLLTFEFLKKEAITCSLINYLPSTYVFWALLTSPHVTIPTHPCTLGYIHYTSQELSHHTLSAVLNSYSASFQSRGETSGYFAMMLQLLLLALERNSKPPPQDPEPPFNDSLNTLLNLVFWRW
jgi:hypothetical protein